MTAWDRSKRRFAQWERGTAKLADFMLRAPLVRASAGFWLRALSGAKTTSDAATTAWCRAMGLPTRRDQLRQLHLLNELRSQVMDLTERQLELRAP